MKQDNIPLISVIIPAYRAELFIKRSCESVLKQTYPNVELVVVDDGSPDKTGSIVKALVEEDDRVRYIYQENGGVSKARNTGLDHAAGEYVMFLDADDELTDDCLETLFAIVLEHNCDIVTGSFVIVRADGCEEPERFDLSEPICIWEGRDALLGSIKDHPATYSVCGKLYRRELLKAVRFMEGRHFHEDTFFLFELFTLEPKVAIVNHPVSRIHTKAFNIYWIQFSDKHLDLLYFANRKYELFVDQYPEYIHLAKNILVKAGMAMINSIRLMDDPRAREVEKECIRLVNDNAKYFISAVPMDRVRFMVVRLKLNGVYNFFYRLYKKLKK